MRLPVLGILLVALAAGCDSPSVGFMGVPATRATVDGSTFSVRMRDEEVEAIRLSREAAPRKSEMMRRGWIAIEQATGCQIRESTFTGDHVIMKTKVKCS